MTNWLDDEQRTAWMRLIAMVELLPGVLDTQLRHEADLTHFEYFLLAMLSEAPERTLRMCCNKFLGKSPSRYFLLRRLNMVRSALQHADSATTSIAEIARSHQFVELGRFSAAYRKVFGEMPSSTLRRPRFKPA